jgi:hypothetical protein
MIQMKSIRDQYDPFGGRAIGSRSMMGSTNAEYGGEMLYIDKSATKPMWMMEYDRDEDLRRYWDNYSPPYHQDGDYVHRNRIPWPCKTSMAGMIIMSSVPAPARASMPAA